MRRFSTASVFGAALLAAVPALAQDEWEQQVQKLIERAGESYSENGYHYGGFTRTGSLRDGATERVTVRLGSNVDNQLVGVCDTDCSDLDLILLDSDGDQVDSDVADDDVPIVSLRPSRDGVYTIEVRMIDCDENPCRYGIQQFIK
ncbi:MAG: hypothetical protein B7Z33_00770 [Sphingomonadales bacterium 12-68-11]|nr:MAG: hypothetical protein B7Z33_00770 [Sphingomonadales bacterium 12-68-11]OYX16949.1 MAG: hypothetical protein B7Z07_01495 [Sphingomonadales bacterium 32-67-7]